VNSRSRIPKDTNILSPATYPNRPSHSDLAVAVAVACARPTNDQPVSERFSSCPLRQPSLVAAASLAPHPQMLLTPLALSLLPILVSKDEHKYSSTDSTRKDNITKSM
jgi:hypothetical protein